ncbi:tyrosine-type recombinase/integrase [Cupriavidus sp. USMAHM13]|uniref:tyrosine-type recombinase/integrase n=1 Tax=Cupriavidus sp. USMAHM13 TaxID=1389192 RepID=UPI0009F43867|nr:site-specific integrase [Cupriavidus sp. USMAHM13]
MASINRKGDKWQVRVRRKGYPIEVKTFGTRQDAERYARAIESEMDRGSYVNRSGAEATTLGDILERYIADVCPSMRGCAEDTIRLRAMRRTRLAQLSMAALTPKAIAAYRDERLKRVKAGTVIRELAYLSSVINHARREWGINIANPVASVRKPPTPQGRNRVLSQEEECRLLAALAPDGRRNPWIRPMAMLGLETAMRRGEILQLRWEHIDLEGQTAFLPVTKNGSPRVVPLSRRAVVLLRELPRSLDGRVFPINAAALHKAFQRACKRAGLADLRWHDLRHTAITRMAAKLPNLIELAAVSGHRSLAMLKRYYHPSATELAKKLG